MLLLAPTEQAQSLSETNARLRFWLDSLARNPARVGRASLLLNKWPGCCRN